MSLEIIYYIRQLGVWKVPLVVFDSVVFEGEFVRSPR